MSRHKWSLKCVKTGDYKAAINTQTTTTLGLSIEIRAILPGYLNLENASVECILYLGIYSYAQDLHYFKGTNEN